jgi:hypothetical protein
MAQIFNPWVDPPSTNTLTGDLASFEINGMEGPDDSGEALEDSTSSSEHQESASYESAPLAQALAVISQQAELINSLMKSLGKTA